MNSVIKRMVFIYLDTILLRHLQNVNKTTLYTESSTKLHRKLNRIYIGSGCGRHFYLLLSVSHKCPLAKSNSFHRIFNFLKMVVAITSWPSSITSHIASGTSGLWPLNYPKLALSAR